MLAALFMEELFELMLHHTALGKHKRLIRGLAEWQAGSILQLQRMAHESVGLGTWKRTNESIPVTEPGDSLGVLDTSNPKHARLVQASAEMNNMHTGDGIPGAKARVQYLRVPSSEHP